MDPPPRRRHEFAGFEDTELLMKMIPGFTTLKRSRGTRQALVDKAEGADIVQPSSDIVANDEMLLQFGSDDEDESEGEREDEEEVGKGMKRRKISGL